MIFPTTLPNKFRHPSNAKMLLPALALLVASLDSLSTVHGMTSSPFPFQETQPDGQVIDLRLHGDTYDSWMTDMDGYTVVKDPKTGDFVYAEEDGKGGLQPSNELVEHPMRKQSKNHPKLNKGLSGKKKGLRPKKRNCKDLLCDDFDENGRRKLRDGHFDHKKHEVDHLIYGTMESMRNATNEDAVKNGPFGRTRQLNPTTGSLKNLVVLVQWSDHTDRILPSPEEFSILLNHKGPHPLCPSGSVRDFYLENSYGKLDLESVVTPWVVVDNTEAYYSNGESGRHKIIWDALRYALQYLDDNDLVDFDYFDQDNNGRIDAITFIHSGYGAEFGGTDQNGAFYKDRIWSHMWAFNNGSFFSKSGVRVREYHISTGVWGTKGVGIGRIGVIAHEIGHFLGLPDLYDVNGGGRGIGSFGIMSNSWGWDGSQYYPPHLNGWCKWMVGWVPAVEPVEGINFIQAIQHRNPILPQLYIIREGFPEGEFLMIENRRRFGYDQQLVQSGILIWHIDLGVKGSSFRNMQMREGYPGQEGWPENGNHYAAALVQADGLFEIEKGQSMGDHEDVFHKMGVDELIPCANPNACQYPNTDSYQGGVVKSSGVYITDISATNDFMSFRYSFGQPLPTEVPTQAPSSAPTTVFGCTDGEVLFEVEIKTDGYPEDTSWELADKDGNLIASQNGFTKAKALYFFDKCIAEGQDYTFTFFDSWGDALCCGHGEGYYLMRLDGIKMFFGDKGFGKMEIHDFFTGTPLATESPTHAPSASPTEVPSQSPSGAPSSAPSSAPTLCICMP
jgi:M6 family metalloprotease-like protein